MDWADTPVSGRMRTRGTHVGRPSREQMLLQDGVPVLCVWLGTPHRRWRSEFAAPTRAALAARSLLSRARGVRDVLLAFCG